jgi:hypothetical protein
MVAKKTTTKSEQTTRTKGSGGSRGSGGSGGGGRYGGGGGDDEPIGEVPENLDIHEAYLRHRLEGGERPSSKAYARAVEQFRKLPGAIRGKPPFIPPDPPHDEGDGDEGSKGGKGGK